MSEGTFSTTDNGLEHLSLPETVHRLLRRRILNNELPAGSRLIEANLALDLSVSRATIRQALQQLATEGLVEIAPRRHSVVTRMSYAEIQDACYARYILEEGAVRAVLAHDVETIFDPLATIIDQMGEAAAKGDTALVVDLDTAFHGCIVHASGKLRLESLWATLNAQMGILMRSSMEEQHLDLADVAERHRQVLDALRSRDLDTIAGTLHDHYLRPDFQL